MKQLTSNTFRGNIKNGVLVYKEDYVNTVLKKYDDCEVRIIIERVYAKRSPRQNRALHKWLTFLAEALNNAGLDMRKVLKPSIAIPWTPDSAKKNLWHPIQKAMFDKESSADLSKLEVGEVEKVLTRHLSEKFTFEVPEWPHYKTEEEYIEATLRND